MSAPPPALIQPKASEVETVQVTRGAIESLRILPGIVRAPTVAARLETGSGRIGEIFAFPGDVVTEGQVLARLHTPELDDKIKNLEEKLEQTIALGSLELEELSTQIRLYESAGFPSSQTRLLRLDMQYVSARHELELADIKEELDLLYSQREQTEIISPTDGEVIHSRLSGALVSAKDAVMHIEGDGSPFIQYIGEPISSWDVALLLAEINGRTYEIRQVRYSLAENMAFALFEIVPPVRFELTSGSSNLLTVGDPIFIMRYTAKVEDALRIPTHALYRGNDGEDFVYRFSNGEQESVFVTVGVITDTFVEILEGLNEGDEIVVRQ